MLVDTGPIVATANARDDRHVECAELLEAAPGPLLVPAPVPLGGVDLSVVAVAERLDIGTVATIDRKHFSVVRPRHVGAFMLLP